MRVPYFSGPDLKGVDLMTLIPVRRMAWEEDSESGRIRLLTPRYAGFLTGRLLQPRLSEAKKFIRIPLEDRGSYLWRQIDGQIALGGIVRRFVEDFPDDTQDAAERIAAYFYQMSDNKFIDLLKPDSSPL